MSSLTTLKRHWPSDRIDRFRQLAKAAKSKGLSATIKNVSRTRGITMFMVAFWGPEGKPPLGYLAGFFDISEAEAWLAAYSDGGAK
jgi:hypothetical protein